MTKENTKEPLKLAKSSVNILNDPGQSGAIYGMYVDYMEIPSKFKDLIKLCRFYYKHDPVAGTVMNKMVDCGISSIKNKKGKCEDSDYEVFDALKDVLQKFYRSVMLEYLLSGLVIPQYEWSRVKGSELSPNLDSRRRVLVPNNIWFRDPATIVVKQSPIPNVRYYFVKVDARTIYFIKNNGKYPDGNSDSEVYEALKKNYPEFFKAVKALNGTKMEILLENIRPILAKTLPEEPYPIPYMTNSLEALMHKRNLRKMDYSVASRVTAAIQMIKLGNDEFPCTDEKDFDHIKTQMNFRSTKGYSERVFQLFSNHTLTIEWVFPDTAAMLSQDKYKSVDDDIISGFGFPRTLITGETIRSNVSGGSDIAPYSPMATMNTIRDVLIEWTKGLYEEIRVKNNFKFAPEPKFEAMRLYKLQDLNTIGEKLYMEGSMSRKSRLGQFGLDLEEELENKAEEKKLYKEYGVDDAPVVPFSSPNLNNPKGTEDSPTPKKKTE